MGSDCGDVTCYRGSFHMLAPATGDARLPTVHYRDELAVLIDEGRQKTTAVVLMLCRRHG